ncbi:MAG: Bax inhibitor-1/YccA family protein [Candidatus Izimaplasma sp.]|nr:Bax inhibitor-1/YccA family protein [Candidatus Izimaplasma bacterium]
MRFRGQNPVYSRMGEMDSESEYSATYGGVTRKTGLLLAIIAVVALYFGSTLNFGENMGISMVTIIAAPIIAIISLIFAHRNVELAWMFSLIYATMEGVFLGFISALFVYLYGTEIVQMALLATFGVLAGMLFLYSTGLIRVGNYFKRAMFSMVIGLLFASVILMVLFMLGGLSTTAGYGLYVGIVVLSVIISSLYLLIDFDNITNMVEAGAGKEYEWMLSLGLVVTIVWLYIELLRLIAIISGRRK